MTEVGLDGPQQGGNFVVELPSIDGDVVPRSKVVVNDQYAFALDAGIKWGFVSGVGPQSFAVPALRPYADKLVGLLKGDVKLTLYAPDGRLQAKSITFEKLWLNLRTPYGYQKDTLILQDRRWTWERPKVTKAYNLTRRSNDLLTFGGQLPEFLQNYLTEARPYFVESTILHDEQGPLRPYTATDIVYEILRDVLGYAEGDIDISAASSTNFVPPNQFIEGETAASVIQRFLALGGNDLYIERDGRVIIYDRTKPFEESDFFALFGNGIPAFRGGTELFVVDYKAIRPFEIEVQHPVEAELLCTHTEVSATTTTTGESPATTFEDALAQLKTGQVRVRNVSRTIVPNQVEGLPRGTVVSIEDALSAYGKLISAPRELTIDDLREVYGDDNAEMLGAFNQGSFDATFKINAVSIYQQIMKDFRSLFQLPDEVRKQLLGLKDVLVDIMNPESQSRVPAEVFSIVSWFINENLLVDVQENPSGIPLNSFDESPYTPVPASVAIEDGDLGLIRINWLNDLDRPGTVVKAFPGEARQDIYGDELGEGRAVNAQGSYHHGVKDDWECSFIISVVPFPNNDPRGRRHFRQVFKATDFGEDGDGPRLVHFSAVDSARFRLPDSLSDYVDEERRRSTDVDVDEDLRDEMGVAGPMVNFGIIQAVGYAEAKRIYRTYNNQIEGNATFGWDEFWTNIRPRASMRNILFGMSSDGEATVTVNCQRLTSPKDILNALPRTVLEATGRVLRFDNLQGG